MQEAAVSHRPPAGRIFGLKTNRCGKGLKRSLLMLRATTLRCRPASMGTIHPSRFAKVSNGHLGVAKFLTTSRRQTAESDYPTKTDRELPISLFVKRRALPQPLKNRAAASWHRGMLRNKRRGRNNAHLVGDFSYHDSCYDWRPVYTERPLCRSRAGCTLR